MYQQKNPLLNIKHLLRHGDVLVIFITINIAVFILIKIIETFLFLAKIEMISPIQGLSGIAYLLSVPAYLPSLASKPWSIITYMFLHEEIWHILMNMLVLYFSGKMFLQSFSSGRFIRTYIWGGIAGGVLFILSYNFFPVFQNTLPMVVSLGASASVLAVLFSVAAYRPLQPVYLFPIPFFQVKLIYLAIIFFIIDIISIPNGNAGGHIAHIGGALYGFGSVIFPYNFIGIRRVFERIKLPRKSSRKSKFKVYNNTKGTRPPTDDDYNLKKKLHQQKVDSILDKISKSGYSSLTTEEKEYLFRNSSKN